ncbi:MAG: pilus assembly protein PilM [bacterium]
MNLSGIFKKKPRRFISLDFGQAFIKLLYIEQEQDSFLLLEYGIKALSLDKNDKTEVAGFITNFLKDNSIPEKETYISISDTDSVNIKHISLPTVPKDEIAQALQWQLKADVSLKLESSLFDWQVVKEYTDAEGARKNDIICIISPREIIDSYVSIVSGCGLTPSGISVSPSNYAHILSRLNNASKAVAVLDIGHREATLGIYSNNKLTFIRKLSFSPDKLAQSLVGTLISDKGKIELNRQKAEEIKNDFGIPRDNSGMLRDNIQAMQVVSLMRPLLEALARELKRSFDYFSSNFKEETPSILYLTGGGSYIKNIDWYLHKELVLEVAQLPLPTSLNTQSIDKTRLSSNQQQLMSALGMALAGAERINLLPHEIKSQKIEFIQRAALRDIAIVAGAVFLLLFALLAFQIGDYRKRLSAARLHLQAIGEIRELKQKIDLREGLINRIQKEKVPVDGLLVFISTIIDENTILNELSLDQGNNALLLKGVVSTSKDSAETVLADFIKRMKAALFFKEVTLLAYQNTASGQEFEIQCVLTQ